MRKTISTYLYALGAIQLLGLNLGAFFWFAWASGISEAKQSSRRWVIAIHSLYLILCGWGLGKWILEPEFRIRLDVFSRTITVPPFLVLGFILLMTAVYGLPVLWLMKRKVKEEFIEQAESTGKGVVR
jgi:hypothetical protein